MANALYPLGKQALLSGSINAATDTIKAAYVTSAYAYSASHQYFSSVTGVIGTPVALGSKTVTNGTLGAANVTGYAVASGNTVAGIVLYKDTGSAATSPLIAFIDTATGLPVSGNGGNIDTQWSGGNVFNL